MTVDLTAAAPTRPAERLDLLDQLEMLKARVCSAERAAANLEFALATNRRIGIAIGILMCRHQLTDDEAFAILRTHSQHGHVKVRDLAESVIFTGTL